METNLLIKCQKYIAIFKIKFILFIFYFINEFIMLIKSYN